jgi:O-6-methylguanine DNA methyltransferase
MSTHTILSASTGTSTNERRTVIVGEVPTPLGSFGAIFSQKGLARLTFPSEQLTVGEAWAARRLPGAHRVSDHRRLATLAEQLTAYLEGDLRVFSMPLDLQGTPFQLSVWRALLSVEYGSVCTYASLAASVGRPAAVRAVGLANGSNPIPIIVPCHRIIGSNGTLTGYGGGMPLKAQLLRLEGVTLGNNLAGQQARML